MSERVLRDKGLWGGAAPLTCKGHIAEADRLPYLEWHEKSEQSVRKGGRQIRCSECGRWFWSWERKTA